LSCFAPAPYYFLLNATSPEVSAPVNWRLALILFLAVLALSLPQAALLPLLDRDEPRFAEASREMLQSGNYIVPTFNHQPRYAKPPLIYWCQTVAYRIFGENAFAARLPSLLATAATACLLYTWGVRFGSGQMGAGAGLCYAFCFQTIQQGRVATADALLIFFMTLTAFTGWLILRPKVPGCVRPICYVVLALGIAGGFLAKGPEALLPVLPLLWCARPARPGVIATLVAGLLLVLLWAIPAYVETNGDYWKVGMSEGVGQRMVIGLQGHGASSIGGYLLGLLFYYPLFFLLGALPVWPLILIHRKKIFTGWRLDPADTYLLLNAAVIFLIFSLMVTKLPHYTLPAFPFLALLLARRWNAMGLSECTLPKLGWTTGFAFALLAAIGIPIAIANHATPSPVGELVRAAGDNLKPDTQFALVDFQEPNTIWEIRRITTGYSQPIAESDVRSFLNQRGPRAVILSTPAFGRMMGTTSATPGKVYFALGLNAAKARSIELTLLVKP
jgi:4-amino-4-deoxy-L-arabinose transferase-like glycosyltransferase